MMRVGICACTSARVWLEMSHHARCPERAKKAVAGIQVLYLKIKPCKQSNIAQENQLGFNQFIHAEKVKNQVDSCKGNNKLLINWKDQPQKLFQHHISDFCRISNQRKGVDFLCQSTIPMNMFSNSTQQSLC